MEPIEIRARREALGLSQGDLASLLGTRQAAVSQWETGTRSPRDPVGVSMTLAALEEAFDALVEELCETGEHSSAVRDSPEVALTTWATDAAYWAADPAAAQRGLPASMHRAAAATAARELTEEHGISVRITTPQQPVQVGQ